MPLFIFHINTPDFSAYIQHFGYIGIFIWFITFDQLTPLPEEISLLLIGYLVSEHIFNPFLAGIFSIGGFITIDIIYYFLARTGSKLVKKKTTESKSSLINSYKRKLKEHMFKTLIVLCFIPRFRLWGPIMVGSMRLPFYKFLLYDAIGLVLFTSIYLSLGIIFHDSLSVVMKDVKGLQDIIFGVSVALAAVVIIVVMRRKYKEIRKKKRVRAHAHS